MLSISQMTEADLDSVCDIERQEPSSWRSAAIRAELILGNSVQLVAGSGSEAVGWACCRYTGSEAELLKIAVARKYRRSGVATLLYERMVSLLSKYEVKKLFLEVRSQNYPAVNFYKKRGFTEVGRRTNYYKQPKDDALALKKTISGNQEKK